MDMSKNDLQWANMNVGFSRHVRLLNLNLKCLMLQKIYIYESMFWTILHLHLYSPMYPGGLFSYDDGKDNGLTFFAVFRKMCMTSKIRYGEQWTIAVLLWIDLSKFEYSVFLRWTYQDVQSWPVVWQGPTKVYRWVNYILFRNILNYSSFRKIIWYKLFQFSSPKW